MQVTIQQTQKTFENALLRLVLNGGTNRRKEVVMSQLAAF